MATDKGMKTMAPHVFHPGKRCLTYCGDEHCNCDCSPFYIDNTRGVVVSAEGTITEEEHRRLIEEGLIGDG